MTAVQRVIRGYERGLYETVEEAVSSPHLATDAEREEVRVALAE